MRQAQAQMMYEAQQQEQQIELEGLMAQWRQVVANDTTPFTATVTYTSVIPSWGVEAPPLDERLRVVEGL